MFVEQIVRGGSIHARVTIIVWKIGRVNIGVGKRGEGPLGKIDGIWEERATVLGRKCCGHTRFAIIPPRGENVTLRAPSVIDAKTVLNREFNL